MEDAAGDSEKATFSNQAHPHISTAIADDRRRIIGRRVTMRSLIILMFIILAASFGMAGEIYGTIVDAGKPVPSGVKIEITAGEKNYSGETDKFGSYHVFVADKGKCRLTLHFKNQKPAADIFSYDRATRYDWIVETVDGKLILKRK
jgi:hypothetical protein